VPGPVRRSQIEGSRDFSPLPSTPLPPVSRELNPSSLEYYNPYFCRKSIVMISSAQLDGIALVVGVGNASRTLENTRY
jgi:hypothetical protein